MERWFTVSVLFAFIALSVPVLAQAPTPTEVGQAASEIYCAPGDTLHFSGHCSAPDPLTQSWLQVNHRPVAHRDLANTVDDDYSFTWSPSEAGEYEVRIGYYLANSNQMVAQKLRLIVLDEPPLKISSLPSDTVADLTATVTANTSEFVCSHAQLSINGTIVQDSKPPFTATLVFKTVPAGTYAVGCVAFDSSGATFTCQTQHVTVPERVQFTFPALVTLTRDGQPIDLNVDVIKGVPVQSVTYTCDGDVIAESNKAPYSVSANLSAYQSGQHKFSAQITLDDGTAFDSDPVETVLTNEPADQRIVAAAAAEAKREAAAAQAKIAADAKAASEQDIEITQNNVTRMNPILMGNRSWFVTLTLKNMAPVATDPLLVTIHFDDASFLGLLPYDGFDNLIPKLVDISTTILQPGESRTMSFYSDDTSDNADKRPKTIEVMSYGKSFTSPASF